MSHVRLNIYPDGGIARLRVYGQPQVDWAGASRTELFDLAAMENGAYLVAANNQHFGLASTLLMPGRGVNMGDGWETRRRREPGHDWAIMELGTTGRIEEVIVDTAHFKGNYPDRCFLQGAAEASGTPEEIAAQAETWPVLLPEVKLSADSIHTFRDELADLGPIRFVRLNIVPDGGVSRLRLIGRMAR